jgi:hypothetical protein
MSPGPRRDEVGLEQDAVAGPDELLQAAEQVEMPLNGRRD